MNKDICVRCGEGVVNIRVGAIIIKDKAIENALAFADQLSAIQDNDINALARDITNEVHGDYYLAQIIKKGVA